LHATKSVENQNTQLEDAAMQNNKMHTWYGELMRIKIHFTFFKLYPKLSHSFFLLRSAVVAMLV
jgi:hypothetical protein